MRNYIIIIAAFATLASCIDKSSMQYNGWQLSWQNGVSISHHGIVIADNLSSEYKINDRMISTSSYTSRKYSVKNIKDSLGKGRQWSITFKSENVPVAIQTFSVYDNFLLTRLQINSSQQLSTNYMAPVVAHTDTLLSSEARKKLFVPYDNDAWIRYYATSNTDSTLRSYEVSCVYDPAKRDGIVIGAINHDKWKNAVELSDGSHTLRLYSGIADHLTRDVLPHGNISGQSIASSTFLIGSYKDWRDGLEQFGNINATVTPRRKWDKAMPVGWNSWGALAFNVNHTNSTEVVHFFADSMQNHSFVNGDGLLYTGLDSGWNSFTEDDLKDFADQCKANHQVPCIYWTPFTDWGKNPERTVPGTSYKYKDIYLYAHGKPQELDGAYAIDPTHPATRKMMEDVAALFRKCGYKYVKMDFMTHGRMEADHWFNKNITTGTEAYNYGMNLLDSIFGDMYLNLSISPIFPAQYAQSRRIACDAWNKIKDTEYTMNALSWGWWLDNIYDYNDADHVVLRDATEGENRARITSSVITGLYITGDDYSHSGNASVKERALKLLTNPEINALATGRSFRPVNGSDNRSEHLFMRQQPDGSVILVVFNYNDTPEIIYLPLNRIGKEQATKAKELWSNTTIDPLKPVTVPSKDVMVFKIM